MPRKPRSTAVLLLSLHLAACSPSAPPVRLAPPAEVPIPQEIGDVPVGRELALSLALAALRGRSGNDRWYTREHAGVLLVRAGDRRVWSVTFSSSPIAGGGGRAEVDADTGEVFNVWIPVGTR